MSKTLECLGRWHFYLYRGYNGLKNICSCVLLNDHEIFLNKELPWWWCRGKGFNRGNRVVSSTVDFGRRRSGRFWCGNFLDVSVWIRGLGTLFTEGLVEGAAQLDREENSFKNNILNFRMQFWYTQLIRQITRVGKSAWQTFCLVWQSIILTKRQ